MENDQAYELHQIEQLATHTYFMSFRQRVEGGWIYLSIAAVGAAAVFVPDAPAPGRN